VGGEEGARGAVELSFRYTEEEYASAAADFYARASDAKFTFHLGVGVFAAALVLAWLAGDPYFGGSVLLGGLVVLAGWLYRRSALRRHFRRNPKFRDEYRMTFSDEGILFRSKGVESRLDWDFYSDVRETPEFYFLVYGEDMFSLIPKRAFRGRRQESEFRGLLRRKLDHAPGGPPRLESGSREPEDEYVPPAEPPDWR
jgi:hypothetical protein